MFKTWFIYILSLIAAAVFFLFYKMWVAWFLLMLLLLIPVISLIVCLIASTASDYEGSMPDNIRYQDEAKLDIKIKGISSMMSFVMFKVDVYDMMTGVSKEIGSYRCDSEVPSIPIDTSHCGSFEYLIHDIRIYDLLGFFCFKKLHDSSHKILVLPRPVIPTVKPDLNGYKAKNIKPALFPGSEIYDIRDYVPGDPMKTVHWKISAKKDKLLVKDPMEECHAHSRESIRLSEDRDYLDRMLGEILFTSSYFLDHDTPHKIRVIPGNNREIAFDIDSKKDLDRAILRILHMNLPKEE
ncbi:MAG: DUF58 domain-containing protein [Clostridiales bacterium]|nr:DUF58 domain-containing protein [Clostridiales bacterium]